MSGPRLLVPDDFHLLNDLGLLMYTVEKISYFPLRVVVIIELHEVQQRVSKFSLLGITFLSYPDQMAQISIPNYLGNFASSQYFQSFPGPFHSHGHLLPLVTAQSTFRVGKFSSLVQTMQARAREAG